MTLTSLNHTRALFVALALTLISYTALPAYAGAAEDHSKHHSTPSDQNDSDDEMQGGMDRHMRMADELKLNDKQRGLLKSSMKQMMSNMHSGKELHEQLRELTQSDNYDEKKVRELIHKNGADMEANMLKSSKTMHEFYASLSAEQKSKFKEMHNDMKTKMKDHRKGHMDKSCDDEDTDG